jgi:AcrR family transcriptional regulator
LFHAIANKKIINIFALTKMLNKYVDDIKMEQSNKNKEQLILEAAEYEFFTKGYNGARTISIAERAGVTHAMLHYYFRTKEQLFEKIMDKNMKQIATIMLSIMTKTDLPFVERLKKSIEDHFDFVANNPLLPQFIFHEIISRPERYEMMKDKLFITVNSMFLNTQAEIDELSSRGEIEWIDAKMLFMSIISLNVLPFIAFPIINLLMSGVGDKRDEFLNQRKEENVKTIMKRIQKI